MDMQLRVDVRKREESYKEYLTCRLKEFDME
jgi:hypothetical protein